MALPDNDHVDEFDVRAALDPNIGDGTPVTAPEVLPPAAVSEPVAIGNLTVLIGGVGGLIALGVPWFGALGFVALVLAVTVWQRASVMPVR